MIVAAGHMIGHDGPVGVIHVGSRAGALLVGDGW